MEVEFTKRDGSRLSKKDFENVKEAVLRLARRPQGLEPSDLLEEARDPSSPLHQLFEWDDAVAAEKYRIEQARKLIYTVQIRVVSGEPGETTKGSAVIRVVEGNSSVYRPMEDVLSDDDKRRQVLDRALQEHLSWEAKYRHLHELSDLFVAGPLRSKLLSLRNRDARKKVAKKAPRSRIRR